VKKMPRAVAVAAGAAISLGVTGVASGQTLLSMSYENLDSSFDADSSTLSTRSLASSTGSMTRLSPTISQAQFGAGFADFGMDLVISQVNEDLGIAQGGGTFTVSDVEGNTFQGEVSGSFVFLDTEPGPSGLLFFNGVVENAMFASDDPGDTFVGSTGEFSTDFAVDLFTGALQRLELEAPNFFTQSFSGGIAEVDAQFVPAPGAMTLLGLGMALGVRRRR